MGNVPDRADYSPFFMLLRPAEEAVRGHTVSPTFSVVMFVEGGATNVPEFEKMEPAI